MQKIIKPQLILLSGILIAWPQGAMAAACDLNTTSNGVNCAGTDIQANLTGSGGILTNAINILIIAAATASVIMIVIGGFRYIFSQGEEKNTKAAKDTILYAIIGLVVSILAFSIVNYVLGKF